MWQNTNHQRKAVFRKETMPRSAVPPFLHHGQKVDGAHCLASLWAGGALRESPVPHRAGERMAEKDGRNPRGVSRRVSLERRQIYPTPPDSALRIRTPFPAERGEGLSDAIASPGQARPTDRGLPSGFIEIGCPGGYDRHDSSLRDRVPRRNFARRTTGRIEGILDPSRATPTHQPLLLSQTPARLF